MVLPAGNTLFLYLMYAFILFYQRHYPYFNEPVFLVCRHLVIYHYRVLLAALNLLHIKEGQDHHGPSLHD